MSEKRFKKGINLSCVDTETGKSYWYACNLCGLLNEQQATIKNYQKSRDKWRTKCHQAEEKVEYYKHKSLDLYKLLRRVNLSDKEWEEFLNIINEKELEYE